MRSSPGDAPGSEPETQALMALVEQVDPEFTIDLHTPLECVLALTERGRAMAEHLAEPTGMRVVGALEAPTFGDSGAWCESRGSIAVTYELELAPLPTLWARHVDGLTRCIVERR